MTIRFEWGELKNQRNIVERGLDFADAVELVHRSAFVYPDNRKNYGEERFIATGLLQEELIVVVYTWRASDVVRIISFRRANRRERKIYEKKIEDGLGAR